MLLLQALLSLVVFVGVFLPIYAVFRYPVATEPPAHRRFAQAMGVQRRSVFEQPITAPVMSLALGPAHRIGLPGLRARVRQDLDASGNPGGYAVDEYLAICLACGVGLGIVGGALDMLMGMGLVLLTAPLLGALGLYAPLWALHAAAAARTRRVGTQLPYTLDLIALVMAAGASFTEAAQTLIRDDPDNDLNQELQLALAEIEFGATRASALAHLADRVPLESLRSVIGAVNQAEKLGTPLSRILKSQADQVRQQRSVRAEKLSATANLRILLPSMLILVAVVVVVFGPIVIRLMRGELL